MGPATSRYQHRHIHHTTELWKLRLDEIMADPKKAASCWLSLQAILSHAIYPVRESPSSTTHPPVARQAKAAYLKLMKSHKLAIAVLFYQAGRSPENYERIGKTFIDSWLELNPEYVGLWREVKERQHTLLHCAQMLKAPRTTLVFPPDTDEDLLTSCFALPYHAPIDTWGSYALDLLRLVQDDMPLQKEVMAFVGRYLAYVAKGKKGQHSFITHHDRRAKLLEAELTENWSRHGPVLIKYLVNPENLFHKPLVFWHDQWFSGCYELFKVLMSVGELLTAEQVEALYGAHWGDNYPRVKPHFMAFMASLPQKVTSERAPEVLAYSLLSCAPIVETRSQRFEVKFDQQQTYAVEDIWKQYSSKQRRTAFHYLFNGKLEQTAEEQEARLKMLDKHHAFHRVMTHEDFHAASKEAISSGRTPAWYTIAHTLLPWDAKQMQGWLNNLEHPQWLIQGEAEEEVAQRIIEHELAAAKALENPAVARRLLVKGYYRDNPTEALRMVERIHGGKDDKETTAAFWQSGWPATLARAEEQPLMHRLHHLVGNDHLADEALVEYISGTPSLKHALIGLAVGQAVDPHGKGVPRARLLLESHPELLEGNVLVVSLKEEKELMNNWHWGAAKLIAPEHLAEIMLEFTKGLECYEPEWFAPVLRERAAHERVRGKLLQSNSPVYFHPIPTTVYWVQWVFAFGFQNEPAFESRLKKMKLEDAEVARTIIALSKAA